MQLCQPPGGESSYSWAISFGKLPEGIVLSSELGTIKGVPTLIGDFAFEVRVTDSEGNEANAPFSILVQGNRPPSQSLSISTSMLPSGTIDIPYAFTVIAFGGVAPYSWAISSGALPAGITIGTKTGIIAGTAAESGTFPFQLTVTDSQTSSASITLSLPILANTTPPNYTAYTGSAIVQWPNPIPNLGALTKNNSIVADNSYPSGSASKIARCTDANFAPGLSNHTFSAGLGGSGDATQMWNADSTALHINGDNGEGFLTLYNKATMNCAGALTKNLNLSSPGSISASYNFGSGSFDWRNPSVWYSFGANSDTSSLTTVSTFTLNTLTGAFTGPVELADFAYGLPLGSAAGPWQPNHYYATGDYATYTLGPTEAPDWTASSSTFVPGDIIYPSINNPSGCAFKLVTVGTTGEDVPVWDTLASGCVPASNRIIPDGTAGWRNLGGPPIFTFQLTSSAGMSGSITPGFVPVGTKHPDLMTLVSDSGLTWTNTGPQVSPAWQSTGGASEDGTRFCAAFSSNAYGYDGEYDDWNGDQNSGIYVVCYDAVLNIYHLLNTATGLQSNTSCLGGTGFNCSTGAFSMVPVGRATAFSGCGFFVHNDKGTSMQDYSTITPRGELVTNTCSTIAPLVWNPFAPFDATTSAQWYRTPMDHYAAGYSHVAVLEASKALFGWESGVYSVVYDLSQPAVLPLINWQVSPCADPWIAGGAPPCEVSLEYGAHISWAHNSGNTDSSPACGTIYNSMNLSAIETAPWQGELVCITTSPSWVSPLSPSGAQQEWRFGHTFATGTNSNFSVQFQISQLSGDGQFLAWGSDWGCTLGTTSGTVTSLCGPPWLPNTAYATGTLINPIGSTTGSGAIYDVFEITTSGTSAKISPDWANCMGRVGCTVVDSNQVVYTDQGKGNARGDVFIVQLVQIAE